MWTLLHFSLQSFHGCPSERAHQWCLSNLGQRDKLRCENKTFHAYTSWFVLVFHANALCIVSQHTAFFRRWCKQDCASQGWTVLMPQQNKKQQFSRFSYDFKSSLLDIIHCCENWLKVNLPPLTLLKMFCWECHLPKRWGYHPNDDVQEVPPANKIPELGILGIFVSNPELGIGSMILQTPTLGF